MSRRMIVLIVSLALFLIPAAASAAEVTKTRNVSGVINVVCLGPLAFLGDITTVDRGDGSGNIVINGSATDLAGQEYRVASTQPGQFNTNAGTFVTNVHIVRSGDGLAYDAQVMGHSSPGSNFYFNDAGCR